MRIGKRGGGEKKGKRVSLRVSGEKGEQALHRPLHQAGESTTRPNVLRFARDKGGEKGKKKKIFNHICNEKISMVV